MMQTHSSILEIYLLLPLQQSTIVEESITRLRVFSFFSSLLNLSISFTHKDIFYLRCKHGLETTFCIRQIVSMALKNGKLFPVLTELPPAPDHLKKGVKCGRKSSCKSIMCSFRRNKLSCSISCKNY
jgi:hypothetical protein